MHLHFFCSLSYANGVYEVFSYRFHMQDLVNEISEETD